MAIFDIMNVDWFQNLVWRLRSHDHFDTLECFQEMPDWALDEHVEIAQKAVWRDPQYAPNAAA